MKPLIFFLSLIFCSHLVFADYDPALGTEYAYTVALPYCPADAIEAWTCGAACKNLTGYKPYYAGLFNVSAGQNLSLAMIYNPSAQKFVTSFRGTVGNVELFSEIMEDIPVPYELIDLPNATVLKYFYTHYITYLRPTMVAKLQEAYKEFPDYSFVFAGHSLGGALTTIACFDAITSGYVPKEKVSLWNYGSPRVGNYEFAQAVVSTVPVIYRVTHWRDMGPHIPPCVTNGSGHCVPRNTSEEGPSALIWPAWHIAPEVFYNLANTEYIVCNEAENRTCADQFDLPQTTFGEHYFYAGVHIACDGNSVIEGGVNEQEEKWESIELLERFKGWGNL